MVVVENVYIKVINGVLQKILHVNCLIALKFTVEEKLLHIKI